VPDSDREDARCLSRPDLYDACVFRKNPVSGRAGVDLADVASLVERQTYGVKLTSMLDTGGLESATLKIRSVRGTKVSTKQKLPLHRVDASNPTPSMMVQTYYWLNRATEYLQARTGSLPTFQRQLDVVVDDTVSGYRSSRHSLHLSWSQDTAPLAASGEIAVFHFGVANLHTANQGAHTNPWSTATHTACGSELSPQHSTTCCKSSRGCARAIEVGVGAYFSALIFPNSLPFGEVIKNSQAGLSRCARDRSVNAWADVTATAAHAACAGAQGDVISMGSIYASIWWEIRRQSGERAAEVETLFMRHLTEIESGDDFRSALDKAVLIDQARFGGRSTSLIRAELSRRGL
jgi:hypothetical protein